MNPSENRALLALLGLPALAYGSAVRVRNRLYDQLGPQHRASVPVVSVGNLTVGGTGKTPVVAWLARWLLSEGLRPAVVSRGYGGRAGKGPLLVSAGKGPGFDWTACGDEPFLLARALPGTIVIVGSDRFAGARAAREAGADVVILDDGFQHRRLGREFDLVLLDATSPFGNYHLLPAGTLREPVSGLRRASAVLITRARRAESLVVIEKVVRRYNPTAPILRAGTRRVGFFDVEGRPVPRPGRAVAFCGIGNPGAFAGDLETEGIEVVALRLFPDHHAYGLAEWRDLASLAREHEAMLLTTEKDLVRLPRDLDTTEPQPVALRIEANIHDREDLTSLVLACLTRAAA